MARENVFPVCQSGGSKTYIAKDKKEGGKYRSSGPIIFRETEDPDVVFTEHTNGNYLNQVFFLSKNKTEYLIDHTEAPETDLVVVNGQEFASPIFAYQELNNISYVDLWLDINNEQKKDLAPIPGSIICIGRKKNSDAAWSGSTSLFLWLLFSYQDPKNNAPFKDDTAALASNKLDGAVIEDGEWATYMWIGTRFVFLGSNNWY